MNTQLANKLFMIMEDLRISVINKSKGCELSKSEVSVLHHIKQYENDLGYISTSDLSDRLNISKPATSQMLNVLEDKKYIQRIINKNDRRLMYIAITELGNEVLKKELNIFINKISRVLDKMGKQDGEMFVELLGKYISIVKELIEQK